MPEMIKEIAKTKNLKTRPDQKGTSRQSQKKDDPQAQQAPDAVPEPEHKRHQQFAIVKEFTASPLQLAETQIQLQKALTILEEIKDQSALPVEPNYREVKPEDPQLSFSFQGDRQKTKDQLSKSSNPIFGAGLSKNRIQASQKQTHAPNMNRRKLITEEIITAIARTNQALNIKTLNETVAQHFATYLGKFLANTPYELAAHKTLGASQPMKRNI